VLVFHHEADGGTGLAATKTLVDAFGRGDIEGRGLLIMERAAGDIAATPSFQGDKVSDNFFNPGGIEYLVYCFLRYHSLKKL